MSVVKHLLEIAVCIDKLVVNYLSALHYRLDLRVKETTVWLKLKRIVAFSNLLMEFRIDIHSILLHKLLL